MPSAQESGGQRQLYAGTLLRIDFVQQVPIFVRGVAIALALGQQISASFTFRQTRRRRAQLPQFRSGLVCLQTSGRVVVHVAQSVSRFGRQPRRFVGPTQRQFRVGPHRLTLLFQHSCRVFRSAFREQCIRIQHVCIADQQRIRILARKFREGSNRLRISACLQISIAEIVRHVIAQIAGVCPGTIQWINCFGVIVIENVGIAQHQPG